VRVETSIPDPAKPGFYRSGGSYCAAVLPDVGDEILDGVENVRRVVKRIFRTDPEDRFDVLLVLSDRFPLRGWPQGPG